MRKRLTLLIMLILTMMVAVTSAMAFTVRWDPNVPSPDGYALYGRWTGQSYDYAHPWWTGTATSVTNDTIKPPLPAMLAPENLTAVWDRATSIITVAWDQPAEPVAEDIYYMVVRAFLNAVGTAPKLESADSEEVNILLKSINTLTKWVVFYSEAAGGPYTILDEVVQTGGVSPIVTAPLTAVADGEAKDIYLSAVAFGLDGTFSINSVETSVMVDRRSVEAPKGISVSITVPVQ